MEVKNTQQNVKVNTTLNPTKTNPSVQKTSDGTFAKELENADKNNVSDIKEKDKTVEKTEDKKVSDVDKKEIDSNEKKDIESNDKKDIEQEKEQNNKEKLSETEEPTETNKQEDRFNPDLTKVKINTKDTYIDSAIDGLQDVVSEISKIGQKDELDNKVIKQETNSDDKKNKIAEEDNILIDNNMNIQEPKEKLNVQTEANMNFSSSEQPFSDFVNQEQSNNTLKSTAKEIEEEKAVLSTMEENIAIARKNMLLKEKAKENAIKDENTIVNKESEPEVKTETVQNDKGIKKVDKKTHLIVDTIVSYDNVIMDKNDVDFFVNLVNNGVVNLSEVQNPEKSSQVSKTLADLILKAMNENKPVRIDFDNDISVIIKIDRAGKISADFLPSSQIAEAYLKENLPLLKQRFDDNNIDYNELNQRKQKQDSQENRKKGRKDE